MFLVELVMQGVRGIRGPARLRFQSGFNFVAAGNEAGKTTAVDAMQRLLFPSGQPNATASFVSSSTPDASRGALVVCGDDGAYYRVIQDFSKRAVNLSKYNSATKEFSLLHKDWDSTAQFMAGLTSGIAEEDFARMFLLRREHYTDRPAAASPAPAAHSWAERRPSSPAGGNAAIRARLAELRETLKKAEEAADADYRHQSAKLALDEIRKKMQAIEELSQKTAELEATLAELKGCETLPENLPELIEERERREGQMHAETENLNSELESLRLQHDGMPSVNLFTDKLFLSGAVLLVLSIVIGLFVLTEQYGQYFPVSVILSLILIAVAWYNGSRKNAQRMAIRKDMDALEQERIELERTFVHEGASISGYLRAVGAGSTAELKEKAENYRYFLSLRNDAEETRKRLAGEHTMEALQEQFDKQYAEVLELERAAQAVAKDAVDTYSIRQDIERLESESSPAEPGWDPHGAQSGFPAEVAPSGASAGEAGFLAELGIASRIVGIEMETLIPAVEAAAQRNLSAVTSGRYVRIEVGHDSDPVVHTKDHSRMNFRELSHGTKELVYFCLRAGLVEALAGKRRLPFILDDALSGFDSVRQQAACQILRALGSKTQVVLLTSNPALRAASDAASELK